MEKVRRLILAEFRMFYPWMLVAVTIYLLISPVTCKVLKYRIREEMPAGTLVSNVPADAQLAAHLEANVLQEVRYAFLRDDADGNQKLFAIGEDNGHLTTRTKIDRDALCPGKVECVIKLDIVTKPNKHFHMIKVEVTILDINDNSPYFPDRIVNHTLVESAPIDTKIALPSAIDIDSPQNGIKEYRLVNNRDVFELLDHEHMAASASLNLRLKGVLDREKVDHYLMNVQVFDAGQMKRNGELLVNLTIEDVNDNNPVFEDTTYEYYIRENAPINSTILTVRATDVDAGLNGVVVYELANPAKPGYGALFGVRETSGDIYLKGNLDFEEGSDYHLVVLAKDLGQGSIPAQVLVNIHVLDENDNRPEITVSTLYKESEVARISESSIRGTFVAHISVADKDSRQGGQFTCSLGNTLGKFRLKHLSMTEFQIETYSVIDREIYSRFTLEFQCEDKGTPSLRSTVTIPVIVADENDFAPLFSANPLIINFKENNNIGDVIAQVNATDNDEGKNGEVLYYANDSTVTVNQRTGIITAAVVFDREVTQRIQFVILASDQGTPPKSNSVTVVINIEDVNDVTPTFEWPSYRFDIAENDPIGSVVGEVSAKDIDEEPNDKLYYSLGNSKEDKDAFMIDAETGQIKTKRILDREKDPFHHLVVIVTNTELPHPSSSASVTVYVADKNDNPPIIEFPQAPNNTLVVSSYTPKGFSFNKLVAHDLDGGLNGRLKYEIIEGNDENLFELHETSGSIAFKVDPSPMVGRVFNLHIQVSDHGTPPIKTSTKLIIIVNDSVPFEHPANTTPLLSDTNLLIVVCVTGVAGFIILSLSLAMVVICCKERQRDRYRYHYGADVLQKMIQQIDDTDKGLPERMPPCRIITHSGPLPENWTLGSEYPSTGLEWMNGDTTYNERGQTITRWAPPEVPHRRQYTCSSTLSESQGRLTLEKGAVRMEIVEPNHIT